VQLNSTMRLISDTLRSTPLPWLPVLSNIEPPALRRKAATDKLVVKIVKHDSWPIQPDILNPPFLNVFILCFYFFIVFFSFSFYCVPCVRFHNKYNATTDIQEAAVAGLATS